MFTARDVGMLALSAFLFAHMPTLPVCAQCRSFNILRITPHIQIASLRIRHITKAQILKGMKTGQFSASELEIRTATSQDLPKIHGLIRNSFAAMEPHTSGANIPWDTFASDLINAEMLKDDFERVYLNSEGNNFWVAESSVLGGVVGCIGVSPM